MVCVPILKGLRNGEEIVKEKVPDLET
jgi:hypothetical protein